MSKHIPRIHTNQPLATHASLTLEDAQAHYLSRVMRIKLADTIIVFNGRDGEWQAEVADIAKKSVMLTVTTQLRPPAPEPDLWLCFAPVKNAKAEFIAEKATELGVSALQPVITQHTVVSRVNEERLLANTIEAAEQCGRLTVPEIKPILKLDALLAAWPQERRLLFCDESGSAWPILKALEGFSADTPWAILIGPEGGFSKEEAAQLRALPFVTGAGLGKRILRADTAAIAALACWQAQCGFDK